MVGERVGDSLYQLHVTPTTINKQQTTAAVAESTSPIQLIHQRFAHVNCKDLKRTLKLKAVEGVDFDLNCSDKPNCSGCNYGKMHRHPFPSDGHQKSENVGDLVHGDVGIVNVPTHDGFQYYSLVKDDASEYTDVKLLKKKNEAAIHMLEFCEMIKTQTGRPVKVIRTDQATEYSGDRFNTWKQNSGIIHQTSCRYTPQQNGVAERANRTLIEGASSSMYNSNVNESPYTSTSVKQLWGEFLCATVYIRNRIVTARNDTTPFEKIFNKKPSAADFRILGCEATVLIPEEIRHKLDPTSATGWLVGYPKTIKGWRIWLPQQRKVVISRDVKFNESRFIGDVISDPKMDPKHNPCEPFRILEEVVYHHRELVANAEGNKNFKLKKNLAEYGLKK